MVFISCSQQLEEKTFNKTNSYKTEKIDGRHKSIDTLHYDTLVTIPEMCECKKKFNNISFSTDLTVIKGKINFNTILDSGSININEIKSIRLRGYDTIPEDFKIFKNVETIVVGYHWTTFSGIGLENFPKFKKLFVFAKKLDLSNNPKWLQKVEVIQAQKTHIIGLESFSQLPKIVKIKMAYGGFDNFPSDFESMKCLNFFQIGAYGNGKIDLTEIDLSNMPCLKFVQFQSWAKMIFGIPKGIEKIEKVKISHDNLTKEEKEILEKISG